MRITFCLVRGFMVYILLITVSITYLCYVWSHLRTHWKPVCYIRIFADVLIFNNNPFFKIIFVSAPKSPVSTGLKRQMWVLTCYVCAFFQAASPPWLLVFFLAALQVLVPTRSPVTPIIFGCPLVSKLKCVWCVLGEEFLNSKIYITHTIIW